MEKFIVSARKYRPVTFDTVVGQAHITTTLKNAIRHDQLAHAFLFCGPRGVGKTTCARILAKAINCENITPEGEACNECSTCKSFNDGASLNYFELDGASNNSVDDIRELVEQVRYVPQTGRYKVYVIDEVHMLSSAAFNAFLKTLEEPPPYVIFILATTEKHKILPTILSRCQIFDFKRITTMDTVAHLREICNKEDIKADDASLHLIAQKSEGCMRDALSMMDKIVSFTNGELNYTNTSEHLNILDEDAYFRLMDQIQNQDLSGALLSYDEINRKGFEGDMVLNGMAEFIRNLLVCKDDKAVVLLDVVESFRERYKTAAKKISPALLLSALNILTEAEIGYKSARNRRLHVELALIRLCYLQQAIELSSAGTQVVKKKLSDTPQAFRVRAIRPFGPETIEKPAQTNGAKLIIEEQKANIPSKPSVPASVSEVIAPAITTAKASKLKSLESIRQQVKQNGQFGTEELANPLQQDELKKAWFDFVEILRKEKSPAVQPFNLAQLRIKEPHSFEAITANNIEKQFIEQNRNRLFSFLIEKLKNRGLQFSVVVEENPDSREPVEIPLSSKEQFLKMADQYPQIKELKDRLRLELDY
ncbi:MAG: DNA polymerase III subunit gamma/tau [Chitinophagaceae bacterium]|nr:DNA polymerase III subunit gamma/tau [Chitinophagaceae bacterium]